MDSITVDSRVIMIVMAMAFGIPFAVQVAKLRLRKLLEVLPDGPCKRRVAWWSKKRGPVVATLLLWLAGAAGVLLPLISDGSLTIIEMAGVVGGATTVGALISNGVHKASKATR